MTLADALLRIASQLAPPRDRSTWLADWQSELWYIEAPDRARFALGSFRDALWLRRHHAAPFLASPLHCLAFFLMTAVLSSALTLLLPAPRTMSATVHLQPHELPIGWAAMLLLTVVLLPATKVALGRAPTGGRSFSLRRAGFFAAKVVLVQPILLFGFVLMLWILPVVPIAPQLAVCGSWFLTFRWVLIDQRQRCPVCLRLLTTPVRIGAPSQTFLAWYGAEATCPRGHGLLHISENPAGISRWLRLDDSWKELFS